jgi:hypothetical protein
MGDMKMIRQLTRRRVVWGLILLLAVSGGIAGRAYILGWSRPKSPSGNSILVIAPYYYQGSWVFDDQSVGLKREPFVAGVPEMIDELTKDVPDARNGFRLLFSAREFPGFQKQLSWLRGDRGGNYYKMSDPPMEGWLCPALFKYYTDPPPNLYVKAEPMRR